MKKLFAFGIILSMGVLHLYAQTNPGKGKMVEGSLMLPSKNIMDNLAAAGNFFCFYQYYKVCGFG